MKCVNEECTRYENLTVFQDGEKDARKNNNAQEMKEARKKKEILEKKEREREKEKHEKAIKLKNVRE